MVERKEVKLDELFIRSIQNCSKHYRTEYQNGTILGSYAALEACDRHLKEFKIKCEWIDTYYYEDEQLLGLFILKWS